MNKETAIKEVKDLLKKNEIEYKDDFPVDIVMVKVGRVNHFLHFTNNSITIISSVKVGNEDVQTTHINRWYEDIEGFVFRNNQLWINDNTLGYMTFAMKQGL